jgi:imidazolonepropionase-like amidohydrolase
MKFSFFVVSSAVSLGTLTLSACGGGPPHTALTPPPNPTVAIVRANLWDGTGRAPVSNAVTLVRAGRIVCAGAAGECPIPAGARIVDAHGRWLIPGLIDTHVHLLFLTHGSAGEELSLDLRNLLAQGVTTVRDMGTNPAELLNRVNALAASPRVYAMQLVAGRRFFFNGFRGTRTSRGTVFRQPPAMAMQALGWTPLLYTTNDDADSIVEVARRSGAMGLKLYAQLDRESVRKLTEAAHRAGMTVWGHAWVQPASALEQAQAGQDGLVHAAGLAGELFSIEERDTLVNDGNLQVATADVATVGSAHDPRILAALDSMALRGTFFEPTLDATRKSVAYYNAKRRHIPSEQEEYVRAASGFGIEITREAVKRGVPISAGSDHVAYGPAIERASLFGELRLLVDSVALSPRAALLAATRDAARALGGEPARRLGTIQAGRYADLVMLSKNPLDDIDNLESVEWIMKGGRIWRPGQLRSGIASR